MEYAEPRYTKDLDIWVKSDTDNAERVFRALAGFGAPLAGLTPQNFTEEGTFYRVGTPPIMIDILFSVEGETFDTAWESRHESEDGGLPMHFNLKERLDYLQACCWPPARPPRRTSGIISSSVCT